MRRSSAFVALAVIVVSPFLAHGQDIDPVWTIGFDTSLSTLNGEDDDGLLAGTVWVERQLETVAIGTSITFVGGEEQLPDLVEQYDRSAVSGAVWINGNAGRLNWDVSASYGQETFEGAATTNGPVELRPRFETDAETWSVAGSLSTTAQSGQIDFTPRVGLRYDVTETDATGSLDNNPLLVLEETLDGLTASVGLNASWNANDNVSLFLDGAALFAENGAAGAFTFSGLNRTGRPTSRQSEDSTEWAELSGGLTVYPGPQVSLSLSIGSTIGRESDETFFAFGVSRNF